ncbi:hypothetical protein D3C71_2159650 [compost metagenome]
MAVGELGRVDAGCAFEAEAIEEGVEHDGRDRGKHDAGLDDRVDRMRHPHQEVRRDQRDQAETDRDGNDEQIVAR